MHQILRSAIVRTAKAPPFPRYRLPRPQIRTWRLVQGRTLRRQRERRQCRYYHIRFRQLLGLCRLSFATPLPRKPRYRSPRIHNQARKRNQKRPAVKTAETAATTQFDSGNDSNSIARTTVFECKGDNGVGGTKHMWCF